MPPPPMASAAPDPENVPLVPNQRGTRLASDEEDADASERDAVSAQTPEVGPTAAFCSRVPAGRHGPACNFWANLTPFSLHQALGTGSAGTSRSAPT